MEDLASAHKELKQAEAIPHVPGIDYDSSNFSPFFLSLAYQRDWGDIFEGYYDAVNDEIKKVTSAAEEAMDQIANLVETLQNGSQDLQLPKETIAKSFMTAYFDRLLEDYRNMETWESTGAYKNRLYIEDWIVKYGDLSTAPLERSITKDGKIGVSIRERDPFLNEIGGYHITHIRKEILVEIKRTGIVTEEQMRRF